MEETRNARRHKRGGDAVHLSLDFDRAEREIADRRAGSMDPNDVFDREWARSLFGAAVDALRDACSRRGRAITFRIFERYVLEDDEDVSYDAVAAELGVSRSDVTNHLAWARREFRGLVLGLLRELTSSEDEFRAEAEALLGFEP